MPITIYPINDFVQSPKLQQQWDALNASCFNANPVLDSKFVLPLVQHFSSKEILLIVDQTNQSSNFAALLVKNSLGNWQTYQVGQNTVGLFLANTDSELNSKLKLLTNSLPSTVIQISLTQQDPLMSQKIVTNQQLEKIHHSTTMQIECNNKFEDYWQARPKKLKSNISRYFRRLEKESISYRFEIISNAEGMRDAIADYGNIESAGWKGKKGTAIHIDNIQGKFYQEVMENFAHHDTAKVFNLYYNEKLVASRLAIFQNGFLVMLKTTYDENYSKYSPGRLLLYLVIEHLFAESNVDTIEFYTKATSDQLQWATKSRDLFHINFYPNPITRVAVQSLKKLKSIFN